MSQNNSIQKKMRNHNKYQKKSYYLEKNYKYVKLCLQFFIQQKIRTTGALDPYKQQYNSPLSYPKMSKHKELFTKNPWHSVSYGPKSPKVVNAIIEIPAESKVKYELDKESGLLKLDRILFSAVHYPHNYGFIPQTYCDDHDPLDILVICSAKVEPLCLVEAKVIGVMRMLDQGEGDDKIIAVANNDMSVSHYNDIKELPEHLLQQVHRFFEDYKKMEKKHVEVLEFLGNEQAWKIVEDSIKLYEKDFGKPN